MRRLTLLSVGLCAAIWGVAVLRAGEPTAGIALRDGLLIGGVGLLLFAGAATPPLRHRRPQAEKIWPLAARGLFTLGSLIGLGAGGLLLYALLNSAASSRLPWGLLAWFGGALLALAGLLWPAGRPRAASDPIWSVAAARRFLAQSRRGEPDVPDWLGWRARVVGLVLLTGLAALIRFWNFAGFPDGCGEATCTAGLAALDFLREDDWRALLLADAPGFTLLTALVFGLFEPGLNSLRWMGLLLGTVTVPLLALAGGRLVRPSSALLGALLLLFAPWHVELSRYPESGTVLLIGILVVTWARLWAGQDGAAQRWGLAGLLSGITLLAASTSVVWAILLWWIVTLPAAGWRSRSIYWLAMLVGSAPRLATLPLLGVFPDWPGAVREQSQALGALLLSGSPWMGVLFGLLALLGLAVLLRFLRWPPAQFLWSGVLLAGVLVLASDIPPALSTLAPLLVLCCLGALVALDQVVGGLVQVWSPALRPVATWVATGGVLLILLGTASVRGLTDLTGDPNFMASHAGAGTDAGRFLYQAFQTSVDNGGDDATLILVPQDLLSDPATQLASGGVLPFARHILTLDPVEHLPLVGPPFANSPGTPPDTPWGLSADGDLLYVAPADDPVLLSRLSEVYPGFAAEPLASAASSQVRGYAIPVSRAQADSVRGVATHYFAGDEAGAPGEAKHEEQHGPLDFDWTDGTPLAPPFNFLAQGLLYVPETGAYTFTVDSDPGAGVRLTLGDDAQNWSLLDTQADLVESQVTLLQGFYPLRLAYASGAEASRLSVRWQRPGGKVEPIPRQALYNLPTANGLLATYYTGEADLAALDDAAVLAQRREPLLLPGPLAAEASAILWQAKLAAPIEGIYELGVEASGRYQLALDDTLLLGEDDLVASRRITSIQLARGWHDLTIRYQPQPGHPDFRLLWQPPGAQGGPIPAQYFAPHGPAIDAGELAIPAAPAFATAPTSISAGQAGAPGAPVHFQVVANELPAALPELPLEPIWQTGSCGDGDIQFNQPRGVVLLPERARIYVADTGNARLVAYDLDQGTPVRIYRDEQLVEPFDLDRNILGDLFLLDAVAQQIFRFDAETGSFAPIPLQTTFYRPRGLGVDIAGMLLVADTGGARVVMLSPQGDLIAEFGGLDSPIGEGQPVDALALPNRSSWAATAADGLLWRLDSGAGRAAAAPSDTFSAPHLAGLSNSSFFLTDPARRLLLYYTPDGEAAAQFSGGNFVQPVGIDAAVVEGNLLLAVTDSAACALSLWQMPLNALPPAN